MARPASATTAGRLVCKLKAEGQDAGDHECDKRFAIAKELKVGGFILKIHRDGPGFASLAGRVLHGSSSGQMVGTADDPKWRNTRTISRRSRTVEISHH